MFYLQIDDRNVVYIAHSPDKLDESLAEEEEMATESSEAEPDFEVVRAGEKGGIKDCQVDNGINIKDNHFDIDFETDEGSDIEVLKQNGSKQTSIQDVFQCENSRESDFERLSDDSDIHKGFVSEDSDPDYVKLSNVIGTKVSLESSELSSTVCLPPGMSEVEEDQYLSDESAEGIEVIKEGTDVEEGAADVKENAKDDIGVQETGDAQPEAFDAEDVLEPLCDRVCRPEGKELDDAIVLKTSVFIIVLCLCVTVGLIVGKSKYFLLHAGCALTWKNWRMWNCQGIKKKQYSQRIST